MVNRRLNRYIKAATRFCSPSLSSTLPIRFSSSPSTRDCDWYAFPLVRPPRSLLVKCCDSPGYHRAGHPSRPKQCRWLRHRILHRSQARFRPLLVHLDDPGLELPKSTTSCLQDRLASRVRPCPSHHRRHTERGQLPPFLPWESYVDAQRRTGRMEAHQEKTR